MPRVAGDDPEAQLTLLAMIRNLPGDKKTLGLDLVMSYATSDLVMSYAAYIAIARSLSLCLHSDYPIAEHLFEKRLPYR